MWHAEEVYDASEQKQGSQSERLGLGRAPHSIQHNKAQNDTGNVGKKPQRVRGRGEGFQECRQLVRSIEGGANHVRRTEVLKMLSKSPSKQRSKRKAQ